MTCQLRWHNLIEDELRVTNLCVEHTVNLLAYSTTQYVAIHCSVDYITVSYFATKRAAIGCYICNGKRSDASVWYITTNIALRKTGTYKSPSKLRATNNFISLNPVITIIKFTNITY